MINIKEFILLSSYPLFLAISHAVEYRLSELKLTQLYNYANTHFVCVKSFSGQPLKSKPFSWSKYWREQSLNCTTFSSKYVEFISHCLKKQGRFSSKSFHKSSTNQDSTKSTSPCVIRISLSHQHLAKGMAWYSW